MYAKRLQKGDEIRVISPSRSLSVVKETIFNNALEYLRSKGYFITFANNSNEIEHADSASVQSRVEDLQNAFLDQNAKAILTSIGGFNVNQILEHIDYSIIRSNPKVICGYSDITALLNAIYAKTGLVTYHGPHFCSFGYEHNRDYTNHYFERCIMSDGDYDVVPSIEAGKYKAIQEGDCEGRIIGGNLCTLNLLQGTDYMPELQDVVLFLEDDNIMGEYFTREFDRNLQSLLQVKQSRIAGIVFGRFAENCGLTAEVILQIVKSKRQLKDIPIIFNADFGHVFPFFTFPIGGIVKITGRCNKVDIIIRQH